MNIDRDIDFGYRMTVCPRTKYRLQYLIVVGSRAAIKKQPKRECDAIAFLNGKSPQAIDGVDVLCRRLDKTHDRRR